MTTYVEIIFVFFETEFWDGSCTIPASESAVTIMMIMVTAAILAVFVPSLGAATVQQYDSSFDRLFQFSSYCQNRPECFRRSDGSVILTLHGYSAGGK